MDAITASPAVERGPVEWAANYLGGLSPRTLNKWRLTGAGPVHLRIGGRIIYDRADLDAFLASCRRQSTSSSTGAAA